jgi:hypothetical protein
MGPKTKEKSTENPMRKIIQKLIRRNDKYIGSNDPQMAEYIRLVDQQRRIRSLA